MTNKEIEIQLALGSLSIWDKLDLANSRRTSKKILTILSTDKDWAIRDYVAGNPNTPKEVLNKLSTDDTFFVKGSVGCNPNTPKEVLIGLGILSGYK